MKRILVALLAVAAAGSLCFATPQAEGASGAPRTLRLEIFDRGNTPGDYLTSGKPAQWVQEAFGKPNNITVEWVPVVRAKEVEKLNIMMAAGDAPDLVFTYSSTLVSDYAKKGGLADLKEPLAKYGRNLRDYLGDGPLSYGVYGGKQYSIPGKRTITGILGSWIRKDWLDALGMPIPTTTDQYLQTMRAFKAKDPGKVGADKVAPVGFSRIKEIQFWNNIVYSFYKPQSEREQAGWFGLETWRCADISIPGAKEGFRFLNTLYNEGLMLKDWALAADNKAFDAAVANGYVGSFTANRIYLWQYNVIPAIRKNSPQSVWAPIDPFTNSEGKTPKLVYQPVGIFNIVPSFSKNADVVVKYMDWQATGDNLDHLMYGVEGTHYTKGLRRHRHSEAAQGRRGLGVQLRRPGGHPQRTQLSRQGDDLQGRRQDVRRRQVPARGVQRPPRLPGQGRPGAAADPEPAGVAAQARADGAGQGHGDDRQEHHGSRRRLRPRL